MNKNLSIFELSSTLREEGYTENSITKLNNLLTSILNKGYFLSGINVIGATGIHPFFKLNEKSVRIRLQTNDVKNEIIVNHPTNTWAYLNNGTADDIIIGNNNFFKASLTQRNNDDKLKELGKHVIVF